MAKCYLCISKLLLYPVRKVSKPFLVLFRYKWAIRYNALCGCVVEPVKRQFSYKSRIVVSLDALYVVLLAYLYALIRGISVPNYVTAADDVFTP